MYRQTLTIAFDEYQREFAMDSQSTRSRAKYLTALNRVNTLGAELTLLEEDLGINRWTKECDDYKTALTLLTERRYCKALDNLERLIVQRLFELTKLGMSGLGTPAYFISFHCQQTDNEYRLQAARKDWESAEGSRRGH